MRKALGMVLLGMVLTTAASGAVVFQDDFESDLSKWTTSGDTHIAGGVLVAEDSAPTTVYSANATSVAKFTASTGTYTLTFDVQANVPLWDMGTIAMPGGLGLKFQQWNNAGQVVFKGVVLSSAVNVASGVAWRKIQMVQNADTQTAEVFLDTGSGYASVWSGSLGSAPDFARDSIVIHGGYTAWGVTPGWCFNRYDNVTLDYVPEPTTMGLLGIGGLLALVRRKRA